MLGRRKKASEGTENAAPRPAVTTITTHKTLGELLIDDRKITAEQLNQALAIQKKEGGFLGQILVRESLVSQEEVASSLVKQCKIPHLSLMDYDIGAEVLALVPKELCQQYNLLPIDKLGRILTVAMCDPLDIEALEQVRKCCPDLRIKPILCSWQHYESVFIRVHGDSGGSSDGKGSSSVTTESLGLGPAATDKPKPAKEKAATPAPQVQDEPATPQVPPTAPIASGGISRDELTAILQSTHAGVAQSVRESMQELIQTMGAAAPAGEQAPVAAAPAVDPNQLAEVIRDGVGGVLQEALATIVVQMRAEAGERSYGTDLAALAETIRTSQAELAQTLATTIQQGGGATSNESSAPQPSGASAEEMAMTIRDSVAGAMQEAIATMVVQMRAIAGRQKGDAPSTESIVATMQQAMAETQSEQNAKLEQIAEAALQSVQQAALLVENATIHENHDGSSARRRSYDSVTPFGTAPPGDEAADADQRLEADRIVLDGLDSEHPAGNMNFDNYLPGETNAFTFKLAQAVAANPGGDYNPFFLYGQVGVGKTHLINAMGNGILQGNGGRVGYVSASHFSQRLMDALAEQSIDTFRENYCCWDVLILDDIQFMGGKVEAQEEFFHIFNTLYQAGRQIIIASDKAPDQLGLLEKRLVSRFGSGIVAELKAPEWETRMEILRRCAAHTGAKISDDILSLIAMRVPGDIRKMTGSLRKIVAYNNLVGQAMSPEAANEILSHLAGGQAA